MRYQVYKIVCSKSHKLYIGYTSKGIAKRFHKHVTNALGGQDTHLYNAIRKYGADSFTISLLWEGNSKQKAIEMEKYYINHYDTFAEGYNQTQGGDGGWCVVDKDEWIQKKKEAVSGENNPRHIKVSDEEILEEAHLFYKENGSIPLSWWFKHCGKKGLPTSYTNFRFSEYGGGRTGFKEALIAKYGLSNKAFKYMKTDSHKSKLSEAARRQHGS